MIGQYQHNIDAKGRLFIPAKYREELGETFYVTLGLDGCLSVYSDAKWAELTAKFDALPLWRPACGPSVVSAGHLPYFPPLPTTSLISIRHSGLKCKDKFFIFS